MKNLLLLALIPLSSHALVIDNVSTLYDDSTDLSYYTAETRSMNWQDATSWVGSLDIDGASWRLPALDLLDASCSKTGSHLSGDTVTGGGFGCQNQELANFSELGLDKSAYWTGTFAYRSGIRPNTNVYYNFQPPVNAYGNSIEQNRRFLVAVSEGNTALAAVPLPATFWLLATGLAGIAVIARTKKRIIKRQQRGMGKYRAT